MKKHLTVIIAIVLNLSFLSNFTQAQISSIFFYKPYTDSIETSFYVKEKQKFDFKTQYLNIKRADVNDEVKRAVRHNDYRIIAISGNSYLYPGLEGGYVKDNQGIQQYNGLANKYKRYLKKYGFKVIMGTSDVVYENMPPLQHLAYNYAKEYNEKMILIINGIKSKTNKNKVP